MIAVDPHPAASLPDLEDAGAKLDAAVAEACDFMFGLAGIPRPPESLAGPRQPVVVAAINFSGPLHGFFRLLLGAEAARAIAQTVFGEVCDLEDPLLQDATGELANVIAGGWKSKLAAPLACCHMSIPSVWLDHGGTPPTARPYSLAGQDFAIELAVSAG